MTVLGWTLKQWGLVVCLMDKKPNTTSEFIDMQRDYKIKYHADPPEKLTVYSPDGDTRPCDYETATRIFVLI